MKFGARKFFSACVSFCSRGSGGLTSCLLSMQYRSHNQHSGGCIQKRGVCVKGVCLQAQSASRGTEGLPTGGGGVELLELLRIYLIHAHVSEGAIE